MSNLPQARIRPTFLQINTRFPLTDTSMPLTRFVRDPYRPKDEFAPNLPQTLDDEDLYPIREESVESFRDANNKTSGHLFWFDCVKKAERKWNFEAKKVCTYRLQQHARNFDRVLAADGVKAEVRKLMGRTTNGKLYMVVGFKTYVNASVTVIHRVKRTLSGASVISPTDTLPVGRGGPSFGVGVGRENNQGFSDSYESGKEDEIVFAMEYKVVRDKNSNWLWSRSSDLKLSRAVSNAPWENGVFGDDDDGESYNEVVEETVDEDLELLEGCLGKEDIDETEVLLF